MFQTEIYIGSDRIYFDFSDMLLNKFEFLVLSFPQKFHSLNCN